jgi:hypothetical protein
MMKLAGAYEMKGNYKDAEEIYTRLKKDYPASGEGQAAQKYITRAQALAGK